MADIHAQPICAELSQEELELLRSLSSREVRLEPGQNLAAVGDLTENFYLLLEGELRVTRRGNGAETSVSALASRPGDDRPGEGGGNNPGSPGIAADSVDQQCPLLLATPRIAAAQAVVGSRLLEIPADTYLEWVSGVSPANRIIVSALVQRVQAAETLLVQREKLAALGKMAAGFAHDLNNPAAAASRGADQLWSTFQETRSKVLELLRQRLTEEQVERLAELRNQAQDRGSDWAANLAARPADPLAQSAREDELEDWLEAHGVEDGWKLAPNLAEAGLDTDWLDSLAESVPAAALPNALAWIEGGMTVGRLLNEIAQSTRRISDLVGAIKNYAYMDRAPVQEVDIHEGLESTLAILGHRLKGIGVVRAYDRALPRIRAHPGELNQVWTNIVDNAADALNGEGQISVQTRREDDWLVVEIADNGPGIPPEIQPRIFEPFFTTKSAGKGLGLGLDISYRIITAGHQGDIRVRSQPGDTRFQVCLPIEGGKS